ncbi:MAG: hypothetical protein C0168_01585 [Candidatus Aminicenantes bacterium]|nr:MAG: hypothetical protein C0168_01585 [Candidatus Aminicenantes bacterium]
MIATRILDVFISRLSEKREFKKKRRDLALSEIDEIRNEIGALYDLAANWMSYKFKKKYYIKLFKNEYIRKIFGYFSIKR